MAKLPTIKEMAEKVAKEALEIIYIEKPELKEISEAYQEGYKQGCADAIIEFVTRFEAEYSKVTINIGMMRKIQYEMHRLAEQMLKEQQ